MHLIYCYDYGLLVIQDLNMSETPVISGFRRDADEICALLRYNAASRGNPLPMFWDRYVVSKRR
jgi:hypothetical protein